MFIGQHHSIESDRLHIHVAAIGHRGKIMVFGCREGRSGVVYISRFETILRPIQHNTKMNTHRDMHCKVGVL